MSSQLTFLPQIQIRDWLTPLDWIVFWLVLGLTGAAIVFGERLKNKEGPLSPSQAILEYLIMGRQLTLPLFIATLVASWYGGIFGVTRIAFESGIYNFVTQGFFWYLAYLFFAWLIVPRLQRTKALTVPELVGELFGPKSSKLSGVFNFFDMVPITYVLSLGILIQLLWGFSLSTSMILGMSLVTLVTIIGGFRAVVFSDLVQFAVMVSSVCFVLVYSVFTLGGWDFLTSHLPPTHFSITGGHGWSTTFAWGLIAFSTLVDPTFYQRCFAARSPQVAQKGILVSILIWILFDLCTTFGAMYARAVMPDSNPDHAYLAYSTQLLPPGLRGYFLAGILATILSTIDSQLFIAGTTLSYDLSPSGHRAGRRRHQLGILFSGLLAIILAHFFEGGIKSVWKTIGSYYAACLMLPILLGSFSRHRVGDRFFLTSCVLSILTTTIWMWSPRSGFWSDVDEIYIGAATSLLVWAIHGLLSPKKKAFHREAN